MPARGLVVWMLAWGLVAGRVALPAPIVPPGPPEPQWVGAGEVLPVPEGAHVALLLDKEQFFLGENILVHYRLENRGNQPFSVSMGSDYRGASRHLRFRVTAVGKDGKLVADPNPSGMCMGGIGWRKELKPGEAMVHSIPLIRHCRFERPGAYTVRAVHDLGWKRTKERKIPVGKVTIKLAMPTAAQARAVAEDMYRLPKDPNRTAGERCGPYADFLALRHPVYLPVLLKRAKMGCEDALTAIGQIPSPEATQALIDLLARESRAAGPSVARQLHKRLPIPARPEYNTAWMRKAMAPRRHLAEKSWRPDFAPLVRTAAKALLARPDGASVREGAALLADIGLDEDFPALVRALDAQAARSQPEPDQPKAVPSAARQTRQALLRALTAMIRRGARPPLDPKSPGEILAYLAAIASRKDFRPEGWQGRYTAFLTHDVPVCRERALSSLPTPEAFAKLIAKRLADPDVHVLIAACHAAGRAKAPELKKPVLGVLGKARSWLLLGAAFNAAVALGGYGDALEVVASRLDADKDTARHCFQHLVGVVEGVNGWGSEGQPDVAERQRLKTRWLAFIRAHRDELNAGRRFKIGHPALKPDLFPRGFRFHRTGQPSWP